MSQSQLARQSHSPYATTQQIETQKQLLSGSTNSFRRDLRSFSEKSPQAQYSTKMNQQQNFQNCFSNDTHQKQDLLKILLSNIPISSLMRSSTKSKYAESINVNSGKVQMLRTKNQHQSEKYRINLSSFDNNSTIFKLLTQEETSSKIPIIPSMTMKQNITRELHQPFLSQLGNSPERNFGRVHTPLVIRKNTLEKQTKPQNKFRSHQQLRRMKPNVSLTPQLLTTPSAQSSTPKAAIQTIFNSARQIIQRSNIEAAISPKILQSPISKSHCYQHSSATKIRFTERDVTNSSHSEFRFDRFKKRSKSLLQIKSNGSKQLNDSYQRSLKFQNSIIQASPLSSEQCQKIITKTFKETNPRFQFFSLHEKIQSDIHLPNSVKSFRNSQNKPNVQASSTSLQISSSVESVAANDCCNISSYSEQTTTSLSGSVKQSEKVKHQYSFQQAQLPIFFKHQTLRNPYFIMENSCQSSLRRRFSLIDPEQQFSSVDPAMKEIYDEHIAEIDSLALSESVLSSDTSVLKSKHSYEVVKLDSPKNLIGISSKDLLEIDRSVLLHIIAQQKQQKSEEEASTYPNKIKTITQQPRLRHIYYEEISDLNQNHLMQKSTKARLTRKIQLHQN